MKVNVLVSRQHEFHVDTLDLQTDRQRAAFIKRAAEELGMQEDVIRKDMGQVFLALERLQSEQIRKALEPAKPEVELSDEDRTEALALLKAPKLLDRILEDFDKCGLVGEQTNKLIGYLAAVSRHLESPLAVLVQSSSAAGKSSLMDAVLAFVPEEERIQFSAMTEQSLYYMGEMDLKHKVLAIVEEEGASRAAYALKLLQSEGVLSIASTGKDPATGKLVTHQYRVEGPVMMFLTTTAIDIDEELLNRCLVLSVNEDREQTQAIHKLQREQQTLAGLHPPPGAARYHPAASERAAIVEAAVRGEPVRRYIDVSRPAHTHAARSHEVPDADPRDRAVAPASTAGENRTVSKWRAFLHRGHARRHRHGGPADGRTHAPFAG